MFTLTYILYIKSSYL